MTDEEMISGNGSQIERLRAIMHRLRSPGGCPWDAEQTHESIVPNLIEEAHETIDAIRRGNDDDLQEELGDLLLQVVFHAEIAEHEGRFDLDAVAKNISDKLIRRHPHVFGEAVASDSDQVLAQWEAIKRSEKGEKEVLYLHGVGKGLPALIRGAKLMKKAAKVGFDWSSEVGVLAKIHEELAELETAIAQQDSIAAEEELGDLLFSVINLVRYRNIDPEVLMTRANEKFEKRFGAMELNLKAAGKNLKAASLDEMDAAWTSAKLRGL